MAPPASELRSSGTPLFVAPTDTWKSFINNEFVKSVDGKTFEVINPSTEEVITSVQEASEKDVDIAVEAARKADTVTLVVKPQDMGDLLDEIAPVLRAGQLVVSLAAGITTAFIEARVPEGVAVVRVMPNTPALVDEGMAAISPGSH